MDIGERGGRIEPESAEIVQWHWISVGPGQATPPLRG